MENIQESNRSLEALVPRIRNFRGSHLDILGERRMSDLFWLSEAQLARLSAHFPLAHGVPRADDRRVISGIIFVIRNGLRWCDAPKDYGPHKILYNRFLRWSRMCVFDRIFASLAEDNAPDRMTIDAAQLMTHRTGATLYRQGCFPAISAVRKAA